WTARERCSLLPARRRTKISALLPVGPQLVILLALRGIAQNLVRLIDLLELLLRTLLGLGHVGMILPGQLAKGLFDLLFTRLPRHAQHFVIIFKLNRHKR